MNFLLLPRLLTAFAVDTSLALLSGILLAHLWLRNPGALKLPSLRAPALLFLLGLLTQLGLLTASFTGETALPKLWAALPDILTTHPGRVAEITIAAALVLFLFTLMPAKLPVHLAGTTCLLLICFALRAATGHAAVDGDFTLAETLQLLHLTSMALWSGVILISGLFILPQLNALPAPPATLRDYLSSVSLVSTWAVATVALTGLIKSYRAIGGDLHQMRGNDWSYVLFGKIAFVSGAIVLGGLNRLHLRKPAPWSSEANSRAVKLLRVEAGVMATVLLLSAWLANLAPPGE